MVNPSRLMAVLFFVFPMILTGQLADAQSARVTAGSGAKSDAEVNQEALKQTQDLLRNQKERKAAIQASPEAQKTDQKVEALTGGGQKKEELYSISADIFTEIMQRNGGDVEKMKAELLKDPEAFFNSLSPAERAKISAFAKGLESGPALAP